MPVNFIHLAGAKKGRTEAFTADCIRIGRDPSNDLQFDPFQDRDASSRHAEITREGEGFVIADLGSTNGTFINGERISRHALADGDVIAFGRGGPKLKFALEEAAAAADGGANGGADAAAPAAPPKPDADPFGGPAIPKPDPGPDRAREDIPQPKLPGPQTMKMILQRAAQKAKSGKGSSVFGGTATFVKEVIRQARDEATATVRFLLIIAGFLFLVLFAVVGWLAFELYSKSGQLDEEKKQITQMRTQLEQDFLLRLQQSQEEFDRLQAAAQQRFEDRKKALEDELQKFKQLGTAKEEEVAAIRKQLENLKEPHIRFQDIARKIAPAIYMVYTRYEVRRKPSAPANLPPARPYLESTGTGFCVTPEGHIVTNKHVLKPWLFSRAKAMLDSQHLEVKRDPNTNQPRVFYAVWPVGTRVIEMRGSKHMSFTGGFNNIVHANLEYFATAPDEMRTFRTQVSIGGVKKTVQVYAHDPQSLNDVGILKAREHPGVKFPFLPMATAADIERLRKGGTLEPIMVMGFPRGTRVLETGLATPSPTIGSIRKVEKTLHVDASISPGNSGGPVIDLDGKVLGIATRIAAAEAETHGFAVPITVAQPLLPKKDK